jgi:NitT/TauT family transport system substrate-binding protein
VYVQFRKIAEDQGLVVVKHIDELAPGYTCCRILTTRNELEKNRGQFVSFLKAQIKAYNIYKTDKARTLEIANKTYDNGADVLEHDLYEYGHFNIVPDPYKKKIENFYAAMVDVGYANGSLTGQLDKYIDTSLYKEALDSVIKEEPDNAVYKELLKLYNENN